jgi:hypothetical protein
MDPAKKHAGCLHKPSALPVPIFLIVREGQLDKENIDMSLDRFGRRNENFVLVSRIQESEVRRQNQQETVDGSFWLLTPGYFVRDIKGEAPCQVRDWNPEQMFPSQVILMLYATASDSKAVA